MESSGLKAGRDFGLAYSPNRIDPGNREWPLWKIPKVVGGIDPDCTRLASLLYRQAFETVVEASSPKAAEATKMLENVFRAVNIALVLSLIHI